MTLDNEKVLIEDDLHEFEKVRDIYYQSITSGEMTSNEMYDLLCMTDGFYKIIKFLLNNYVS